jgi:Pyruvate/2-oxoacid:ferredoxin oxidoreductase delta subunit
VSEEYPLIDYSRRANCVECIAFCLFGVDGVDRAETVLVEQPDNCRKGRPACSRVCPENAIIFPQHKSPAIAGSPDENAGGLKIDLSLPFRGPSAIEVAAQERDVEPVAVGRDAVELSIGIPKRQEGNPASPKDDLMDQLDEASL